MGDVMHLVYEYRRLLAHRELSGGRLDRRHTERLAALHRLFGREPEDTDGIGPHGRRRHARCEVGIPATLVMGRRVLAVEVVDIGGGGVRIAPAPPLRPGERARLRIPSPDHARVVYEHVVEATWSSRGDDSAMGMPFIGVPRQLRRAG